MHGSVDVSNAGRVTGKSVTFVTPFVLSAPGGPDPAVIAMLAPYRTALSAILNTQVGTSTVAIPRADSCGQSAGRTCESLVGDVVTDALRTTYATAFAITNSGGLRADLSCPTTPTTITTPTLNPRPLSDIVVVAGS